MRLMMITASLCVCVAGVLSQSSAEADDNTQTRPQKVFQVPEESPAKWFAQGASTAIKHGSAKAKAKNIILFVGDGMSLTTVAASRIYEAQLKGRSGEENQLSFETMPYTGLSKTYNTDSQTPDSAGTMSAMITGVKTRMGMLSVDQTSFRGNCKQSKTATLMTAVELAEMAGLSTGVVTTTGITHATPGATYAHVPERNWENDTELSAEDKAAGCRDIAQQFVDFNLGDGIEVALGGGRQHFLAAGADDPEYQEYFGARLDGRNLIAEWQKKSAGSDFVWNKAQLEALDLKKTKHLLGLFEPGHMNFESERSKDRAGEPSLAEMTRTAITVLKNNPNGFFLMVEGGRIDHAHHSGNAFRAVSETVAFSNAVRMAMEMTSDKDTLIIVTADHSHTMTFAGYPTRGNPILGKVVGASGEGPSNGFALDAAGMPYTTLGYANGPGYVGATDQQPEGIKKYPHQVSGVQTASGRPDLRDINTEDHDFMQEAAIPLGSETHGGDDVGIWARGPGANAVRGTVEQNVIFHYLTQANPRLRKVICSLSACKNSVPTTQPIITVRSQDRLKVHQ
jgi:alkaline phosphatase